MTYIIEQFAMSAQNETNNNLQQNPSQLNQQQLKPNEKKQQIGNADQQHLTQDYVIKWIQSELESQFQELEQIDYEKAISEYITEKHHLSEQQAAKYEFRLEEVTELKEQLGKKYGKNQKQQQEKQEKNQSNLQKSKIKKGNVEQENKNSDNQEYLYPSRQNKKQHSDGKDQQEDQNLEEDNEFNQFEAKNVQANHQGQVNNDHIGKNYKEYLRLVFDHYCRMSYATGNDPTFEQIQQKTNIMTINKFMIFCKEFGVVKLNSVTRSYLLELFKKNSEYYKEMNFQQFLKVLLKISQIVYNVESQEQPKEESKEFQQFLLFLEVNNFQVFKKKMQSLSIAYRPRGGGNSQVKKPVLSNYKFKYAPSNGKSEKDVKDQIQERKQIRSEHKLKIHQKDSKKLKDNTRKQHQLRNLQRGNLKSTPSAREKLVPPKPPARRTTAQNLPKTQAEPITGYANIHRMKKMREGGVNSRLKLNSIVEDAKKMVLSNAQSSYHDQLIQDKLRGQRRDTPIFDYQHRQNYSRDPSYSDYSDYSRQYSQKQLVHSHNLGLLGNDTPHKYQPYGHSQLQKREEKKLKNDDLDGLLNQDSDEDEYLQEHLNREVKNDRFNKRIQAKIKNLEER